MNDQNGQSGLGSIFQSIFNSLPGNAVVIDSVGKIAKTNLNWNEFAISNGIDAGNEWIGQNYLEVCKKLTGITNEKSAEACIRIKAILSGEESDFELDYQGQKSGEPQWFRMQASGFEFEGSFFATIIHEDITERVEAEKKLRQSEALFRGLMEQSPFSVNISNIDGSIKEVNAAFMKMWGITDETIAEFYEKFNFWKDEQANEPENMSYIMRAFNGEAVIQPPIEYDGIQAFEAVDIKSRKRWLQNRIYPVKDSNGELLNMVWLTEDISERVEAEKKIQESI